MNRKTDFHQNSHVCDVLECGLNILPGPTETFYPELKLELLKTFSALHPCFQDLRMTGMDARPSVNGYPLEDLINLK